MGRRGCRFLGNFNSLNPNSSSQPATHAARLSKSVTHFLSEISIAKRRKFRGSRRGPVAHRHCAPPGKFERGRKLAIKSSTEKRQPSDYLISLDQQHCLADVAQGEPGVECMLSRMVDRH